MIRFYIALICTLTLNTISFAQTSKEVAPNGWHMMDKETDGYYGISSNKAYEFIKSKKLKSKRVLVAVIDSGIDTLHEDLKPVLWSNPKEIPGNGIDDDKNGYIDDIHGWNFIGGKDGRNVDEDTKEETRIFHSFKSKYNGKTEEDIDPKNVAEFKVWEKAKEKLFGEDNENRIDIVILRKSFTTLLKNDSTLKVAMAKEVFTGTELESLIPKDAEVRRAKNNFLGLMKLNNQGESTNKDFMEGFGEFVNSEEKKELSKNEPLKDLRAQIVKDDETNINDRYYGNNDLSATPMHGTHCAGIIGAVRNNDKGVDGIADNVRIMMIRAVPDGDEHDKDVANAIRYAVDNGAQIISMSFGKDFSPQKQWVDDAIRYAESKNVLLVKAAGNDNKNVDVEDSYPSVNYLNGKGRAGNVITVGASGDPKTGGLAAYFSNYGKKEVDVFSPGVKIYSTLPGGTNYGNLNGTSMACPLVAGIAALTLEYFPTLSAKQLKMVIEKSAQMPPYKVTKPGSDEMVNLADISKTGGIVNAYETLKLAATIKGERKVKKEVLPKPKMVSTKKG